MNRLIGVVAIVISEKLFYYFYTIKCYFSPSTNIHYIDRWYNIMNYD